MHRHAGAPTDKLVGRTLNGDIDRPALALQRITQVGGQFDGEAAVGVGGTAALLEETIVKDAAVGIVDIILWVKGGEAVIASRRRLSPVEGIGFGQQPPGNGGVR